MKGYITLSLMALFFWGTAIADSLSVRAVGNDQYEVQYRSESRCARTWGILDQSRGRTDNPWDNPGCIQSSQINHGRVTMVSLNRYFHPDGRVPAESFVDPATQELVFRVLKSPASWRGHDYRFEWCTWGSTCYAMALSPWTNPDGTHRLDGNGRPILENPTRYGGATVVDYRQDGSVALRLDP